MNRRNWTRRIALALIGVIGLGCSLGDAVITSNSRPGRRILFIGSQPTYFFNMPLIVEAMGDSADLAQLSVDMVAFPDFSLRDHQLNGGALTAINNDDWELVVLQQGPSNTELARAQLRESTKALSIAIKAGGARPALYMTWPAATAAADFPAVIDSYTLAAADVDGLLIPVGVGFQAATRRDATIPLYASDGLSPTPQGSYLAAAVIFAKVYNKSPVGVPARLRLRNGDVISIPAAQAAVLQAAAAEATGFITA